MKQNSGYLLLFIFMTSGIYMIRNLVDDKKYVGSTGKLEIRWNQHKAALNRSIHFNSLLQRAWRKHGKENFVYEIIELCEKEVLLEREEYWIKEKKSHKSEHGYNFCKTPRASRLGCKASPETIAKMRASLSGKNHPLWGKKMSKRWISNMKKAVTGIPKPSSGRRGVFVMKDPSGKTVEIFGLRKFCRDNNLIHSMMWRVARGKQKEYRGWTK